MHKSLCLLILFVNSLASLAQSKLFTDQLQSKREGQGQVILHQSQAISDLVNGTIASSGKSVTRETKAKVATPEAASPVTSSSKQDVDTTTVQPTVSGQRVRVNGYRIQVYSGGNSRQSKIEAQQMGARVRNYFAGLSVYTHFVSPHWICRVGDFKTYEEANEVFQRLKETGRFSEAVIVKSKVYTYY